MPPLRPVLTLTTDFGTRDSYVGVMKGVIAGICPDALIIDITHEIAPQDILAAAGVIQAVLPYFPDGSIHVVVVDPGVGSTRRPIALQTPQARFVGPDNGVFGMVWQEALRRWPTATDEVQGVALTEPRFWLPSVSATFHGRDIFAPVAAYLATGVPLTDLGTPVEHIVVLPAPQPVWVSSSLLEGQVVSLDHFGNARTNITTAHLAHIETMEQIRVTVGAEQVPDPLVLPICHTYADVPPGKPLALIGSSGQLEISVRDGNAGATLGLHTGTRVQVVRG